MTTENEAKPEKKVKAQHSHVTNKERTAYRVGEKVEYDGKLAKVIEYGYLELPTNPGEDAKRSASLLANLQLPALSPGGKPEYARFVDPDDITSLRDDPKRQRALEIEFNPLFGELPPADPAKDDRPAPVLKKAGAHTPAETPDKREAIDVKRAVGDDVNNPKTVDTSKRAETAPKATAKKAGK